jgi:tRNA dimethylallyltransferase
MATGQIKTIYIVGPTASGKSSLAMRLAKELNAEIVCADSRTVYQGLDIATAKPSSEDRLSVPHYGLDIIEPDKSYSAARFQQEANDWLASIHRKGKLAIVVGGTGLYIDGLFFNYEFGEAANEHERERLQSMSLEELQNMIKRRDIAMPSNFKNKRHLIRAIEQGGINTRKSAADKTSLIVGIAPDKDMLLERIKKRADVMIQHGAIEETAWLLQNYGASAPAAASTFYKAFIPHVRDGVSLQECVERYIQNDLSLAKRQMTWFKRNPHILWAPSEQAAYEIVHRNLK